MAPVRELLQAVAEVAAQRLLAEVADLRAVHLRSVARQVPSVELEELQSQVEVGSRRQVEAEPRRQVWPLEAVVLSLERQEQRPEEVALLFLEPVAVHQRQELAVERLRPEVEEYQHLVV